jgi:hypothetical protein
LILFNFFEAILQHEKDIQALAITNLQMKGSILEGQLNLIPDTIKLDSTRWEIKHGTIYEEEISNIIIQNKPDKTRNLAYVVNDQRHDIRNAINTADKKLKKKDRVIEILTHHGRNLNSEDLRQIGTGTHRTVLTGSVKGIDVTSPLIESGPIDLSSR